MNMEPTLLTQIWDTFLFILFFITVMGVFIGVFAIVERSYDKFKESKSIDIFGGWTSSGD